MRFPGNQMFAKSTVKPDPSQPGGRKAPQFVGETMSEEPPGYMAIDSNARIKGDINTQGDVVVDGCVEGTVVARKIIVTANGRIHGKVTVQTAKIYGSVEPELHCKEVLEIASTGLIRGKCTYGGLVVEMGGRLLGEASEFAIDVDSDPKSSTGVVSRLIHAQA
jgi:cytoskeletal protein CcmA (bactofilin family)